jgi:hypothetical protein
MLQAMVLMLTVTLLSVLIFYGEIRIFFQSIQHERSQDASCCPQPKFPYKLNTIFNILKEWLCTPKFNSEPTQKNTAIMEH